MTKPKAKDQLKAYRGTQSYLTEAPQISKIIINYMHYYNHYCYQWDLAKLSPAE